MAASAQPGPAAAAAAAAVGTDALSNGQTTPPAGEAPVTGSTDRADQEEDRALTGLLHLVTGPTDREDRPVTGSLHRVTHQQGLLVNGVYLLPRRSAGEVRAITREDVLKWQRQGETGVAEAY